MKKGEGQVWYTGNWCQKARHFLFSSLFLREREGETMCYLNSYMKRFLLPEEGG